MTDDLELDVSRYPRISELFRVELRDVDAVIEGRRFRLIAYEDLREREGPVFLTRYHELVEIPIDAEPRLRWVDADFPLERRETAEECLHAGLAHLDALAAR